MSDLNFKIKNGLDVGGDILLGTNTLNANLSINNVLYGSVYVDNNKSGKIYKATTSTNVYLTDDSVSNIGSCISIFNDTGAQTSIRPDTTNVSMYGAGLDLSPYQNQIYSLYMVSDYAFATAIKFAANKWIVFGEVYW